MSADDFITRYDAMLKVGELRDDPSQKKVAAALQVLGESLAGYRLQKGGLFSALLRKRNEAPKGLYIYGDVGRGKSMLMDLFFECAPVRAKSRVHFHEFMQDAHEEIHQWRGLHKQGKVKGDDPIPPVATQIAKRATLLCFDEFHVSDIADAMILGRLFTSLFEAGVVVVATSNMPPDALYENGLNRALFLPFLDLLGQRLNVLKLEGDIDYRLDRLKGLDVYHTPLGKQANEKMQQAWMRLTDCEFGDQVELSLKGRAVTIPQAARGVARFSFASLCQQPLGAADYLKIAHHFHTLLIDHVPRLDKSMKNEAKRFVILIDALYENKVKLIASSEAEPDQLYPQGNLTFEFKRTISRLREMQSTEYLALAHGTATQPIPETS